jgi:hypothetical protein
MAIFSKTANGNIRPSRFVKLDSSGDNLVAESDADDPCYGISQAGTRRTPYSSLDDGYAAIAGEDLEVFGVGEVCMLELGATATVGARLKSDADGKGTPVTTDLDEYGAIALVAGTSGKLIQVLVQPMSQYGV